MPQGAEFYFSVPKPSGDGKAKSPSKYALAWHRNQEKKKEEERQQRLLIAQLREELSQLRQIYQTQMRRNTVLTDLIEVRDLQFLSGLRIGNSGQLEWPVCPVCYCFGQDMARPDLMDSAKRWLESRCAFDDILVQRPSSVSSNNYLMLVESQSNHQEATTTGNSLADKILHMYEAVVPKEDILPDFEPNNYKKTQEFSISFLAGQIARVESSCGQKRLDEERQLRKVVLQALHISMLHISWKFKVRMECSSWLAMDDHTKDSFEANQMAVLANLEVSDDKLHEAVHTFKNIKCRLESIQKERGLISGKLSSEVPSRENSEQQMKFYAELHRQSSLVDLLRVNAWQEFLLRKDLEWILIVRILPSLTAAKLMVAAFPLHIDSIIIGQVLTEQATQRGLHSPTTTLQFHKDQFVDADPWAT